VCWVNRTLLSSPEETKLCKGLIQRGSFQSPSGDSLAIVEPGLLRKSWILPTHQDAGFALARRRPFEALLLCTSFCPIMPRLWCMGPQWLLRVTGNWGSIPEKQPERRLLRPRLAAGTQIAQSRRALGKQRREVVSVSGF